MKRECPVCHLSDKTHAVFNGRFEDAEGIPVNDAGCFCDACGARWNALDYDDGDTRAYYIDPDGLEDD